MSVPDSVSLGGLRDDAGASGLQMDSRRGRIGMGDEIDNGLANGKLGGAKVPRRRMARKAEQARESRRRKKAYIQSLVEKERLYSERVEALEKRRARTLALMGMSSAGQGEQARREQQLQLLRKMETILAAEGDAKRKDAPLTDLMRQFSNNSRSRQAQVDGLVEKVAECLRPGPTVQFGLWVLSQPDEFYDRHEFWPALAYREIGLSAGQAQELKAHRAEARSHRQKLSKLLQDVERVRVRLKAHLASLNGRIDQMQSILTPAQRSKFLLWVAKNKWCMEMMKKLWKKR